MRDMSLWAAEFDTSLLMTHDVVIYCPSESLADELMVLLEEHGVQWSGNKPPTSNKHWGEYEYQCYYISSRGSMLYGPPDSTDDDEWRYYIKCTFLYVINPQMWLDAQLLNLYYNQQPVQISTTQCLDTVSWSTLPTFHPHLISKCSGTGSITTVLSHPSAGCVSRNRFNILAGACLIIFSQCRTHSTHIEAPVCFSLACGTHTSGGDNRARTDDFPLKRRVLYQLSYIPPSQVVLPTVTYTPAKPSILDFIKS